MGLEDARADFHLLDRGEEKGLVGCVCVGGGGLTGAEEYATFTLR